jgi:hypothetical protein
MNAKAPLSGMTHALEALLESDARSATVYLSPTLRATASYTRKPGSGHLSNTVAITFGKPNWDGRLLIAKCKRRGIDLPIDEPQLKPWPKVRKRRRKD